MPDHQSDIKRSRFGSLRSQLEEFLHEMTYEERHVRLGVAWSHYVLGYITLDELRELRAMLGFSEDDMDSLGI